MQVKIYASVTKTQEKRHNRGYNHERYKQPWDERTDAQNNITQKLDNKGKKRKHSKNEEYYHRGIDIIEALSDINRCGSG